MKPEARVVQAIRRAIAKEWPDSVVVKYHGGSYGQAGVADLLCCIEGIFVAIEVKAPGKAANVTDLQQAFLHKVDAAGGLAFSIDGAPWAISIIKGHLTGMKSLTDGHRRYAAPRVS